MMSLNKKVSIQQESIQQDPFSVVDVEAIPYQSRIVPSKSGKPLEDSASLLKKQTEAFRTNPAKAQEEYNEFLIEIESKLGDLNSAEFNSFDKELKQAFKIYRGLLQDKTIAGNNKISIIMLKLYKSFQK